MPLVPLSERQSTVAYAVDLLHAHKIRRENVFLHDKVTATLKELELLKSEVKSLKVDELPAIRSEVKQLTATTATANSNVQQALILGQEHKIRLVEQDQEINSVRQSCTETASELLSLKNSLNKQHADGSAATNLLEPQLQSRHIEFQRLTDTYLQQAGHIQVTLESFRTALDEKADTSVIQTLAQQLDKFNAQPIKQPVLPSVSRVSESIQMLDSQPKEDDDQHFASRPSRMRPSLLGNARATIPDDLDLDANAHTISYVGHVQHSIENQDSLRLLPSPIAQGTQLAKLKTLQQRKFHGWDMYFKQGQELLENLPSSFEETVVHNFVDGISSDSHKRQCQDWLNAKGWRWANIKSFGDLCSQVLANDANEVSTTDLHLQASPSRQSESLIAQVSPSKQKPARLGHKRCQAVKGRQSTRPDFLRRSQRLAEKNGPEPSLPPIPSPTIDSSWRPKELQADRATRTRNHGRALGSNQDLAQIDNRKKHRQLAKKDVRNNGTPQGKEMEKSKPHNGGSPSREKQQAVTRLPPAGTARKRRAEFDVEDQQRKRQKSNPVEDDNVYRAKDLFVVAKQQTASPGRQSSADEGLLYSKNSPILPTHARKTGSESTHRPRKHAAPKKAHQYKVSKRQRPISPSPPPEIPILPTTDEE